MVLALGLSLLSDVARACPGCASPLEENRQAFVDTTIFLTVLPLLMIGGLVWWLRRRLRQAEAEQSIVLADDAWENRAPWSKRS